MGTNDGDELMVELSSLDHPRVLVVDDDPALLAVARRGLSGDYEVFDAPTGAAALWIASLNNPDVVILDLDLPDMPGHEVMRRLRDKVGCMAPVIMLTGSVNESDELDCLRAGVDDFIRKPYDMARLKARIENMLKRSPTAYSPPVVVADVAPGPVPAGSHFTDGDVFVWTADQES